LRVNTRGQKLTHYRQLNQLDNGYGRTNLTIGTNDPEQVTQPGTILRLNGQGLAVAGTSGDLFVEIKVSPPKTLTEEQRKMIEEWME